MKKAILILVVSVLLLFYSGQVNALVNESITYVYYTGGCPSPPIFCYYIFVGTYPYPVWSGFANCPGPVALYPNVFVPTGTFDVYTGWWSYWGCDGSLIWGQMHFITNKNLTIVQIDSDYGYGIATEPEPIYFKYGAINDTDIWLDWQTPYYQSGFMGITVETTPPTGPPMPPITAQAIRYTGRGCVSYGKGVVLGITSWMICNIQTLFIIALVLTIIVGFIVRLKGRE